MFILGNGIALFCPSGSYCELGSDGPLECPLNTYRHLVGGKNITDCFACPAGYWCNITGLAGILGYECPVGYYCLQGQSPVACPGGTLRSRVGAKNSSECLACPSRYYCPDGIANIDGIPCSASYYCPIGSALQKLCPGGHYCPAMTGKPLICPGRHRMYSCLLYMKKKWSTYAFE